jgi:hypothetical protein
MRGHVYAVAILSGGKKSTELICWDQEQESLRYVKLKRGKIYKPSNKNVLICTWNTEKVIVAKQ